MLKKIASKEYPGYYEIVPTRAWRLTKFVQSSPLFRLRPAVVALMFFFSFLYFGALPVKAALVSISVYVLMILSLGGRHLERIGLVIFTAAATAWLDIVNFEQLARSIIGSLNGV